MQQHYMDIPRYVFVYMLYKQDLALTCFKIVSCDYKMTCTY